MPPARTASEVVPDLRGTEGLLMGKPRDLAGPLREVVYIFEREGVRGGGIWWLVLDCGHAVARKRYVAKHWAAQVHMLLRPIEEKLAPKRVQCHSCGSGAEKHDPAILIKAFGGDVP
jgi:hypothetical protein